MLKCAIIGTGAVASSHIEAYKALEDRCTLTAMANTTVSRAVEKAEKFALTVRTYADYRMIVDDPSIDLVSICTPPATHARIAVECLNAGKHVLVEKPMAASLAECDAMIAAAAKNGKVLSVVAQNRFRTQSYRVKQLIDSKLAGELLHVAVNAFFWRGKSYYDLHWRGTWQSEGGGCTLNHAVHFIDLLLWLAGKPARVAAFMTNNYHDNSETEDLSEAILQYADGKLASITSSLVHHGEKQGLVFQAEKAGFSIPFSALASRPLENGFPEEDKATAAMIAEAYEGFEPLAYEGHTGQLADVVRAIETGGAPLVDGQQGRAALELIMAIYKAATGRTVVELPLKISDPFYTKEGMLPQVPVFHHKTRSVASFAVNDITIAGDKYSK